MAVAHITGVVEYLAPEGLTTRQYLQAVLKHPLMLPLKPETVIGNIEGVVKRFAHEGLTTQTYLRAVLRQPSMFTQKPDTLAGNIEAVVRHFAGDGLTVRDYLRAAVKQPALFYQSPQTIIGHINLLAAMHEKKLLPIPAGNNALMELIVRYPALITFAEDNLHLREIVAHLGDESTAPIRKTREYAEHAVKHALRPSDSSEKVSHARRLLLNALKREGYIKER